MGQLTRFKSLTDEKPTNKNPGYLRNRGYLFVGAEGETRTPTSLRTLDPEPSVSTNSTTSA